jgi:heterodisulfide reductase subunit A
VTTGYDLYDARTNEEYGFGRFDNVITGMTLERVLNVSGPTGGHVVRLSDGKIPRKVSFIQCVGPRDKKLGSIHCSKVCCMYATKQAELLKKSVPGVDVSIYYLDAQAFDKKFDEFYQKAKSEFGVRYIKAEVNRIQEKPSNNNLLIQAKNLDSGEIIENEVDLVVLSTGLVPAAAEFARILPLKVGEGNFFVTADPEIDGVTTNVKGVFVAGVAEAPKNISDSITQADTAAVKAAAFLKE